MKNFLRSIVLLVTLFSCAVNKNNFQDLNCELNADENYSLCLSDGNKLPVRIIITHLSKNKIIFQRNFSNGVSAKWINKRVLVIIPFSGYYEDESNKSKFYFDVLDEKVVNYVDSVKI